MSGTKSKTRSIERKIYFYKVVCRVANEEVRMDSVFNAYINLLNGDYSDLEKRGLVIPSFEKYHFLDVDAHDYDKDVFKGKFYSLRTNDFPYLFNMSNGSKKEIAYTDQDTLMEQTHFYCFANQRLIVSEYNFYGARIERLGEYLSRVMLEIFPSKRFDITVTPIVIPDYFEQIIGCTSISKVQFKVAHPGLRILAEENIIGLSDIARSNLDETSDFCIDIELSGGKRGKNLPIKDHKTFLSKIVSAIKKGNEYDATRADGEEVAFRKAKIKAYNPNEFKLVPYDLLDEKLVYTCYVEKLSNKSKYVNSDKMYSEIMNAYSNQKDDALKYMETI
jgi:hypothetical protein